MNRYLLVDFENNCISNINKVEINFEENEIQTSSISCIDNYDLIKTLFEQVKELKEQKDKEEKQEEQDFLDIQYGKMKKYIYNTSDEELEKHYQWYQEFDRESLLNTMFESYCCTYDDENLEKEINKLLEA